MAEQGADADDSMHHTVVHPSHPVMSVLYAKNSTL